LNERPARVTPFDAALRQLHCGRNIWMAPRGEEDMPGMGVVVQPDKRK
jgi:hypothetical protein